MTEPSETEIKHTMHSGWVCTHTKDNLDNADLGSEQRVEERISGSEADQVEQPLVSPDNLAETMPLLRLTPSSINKLRHKMFSLLSSTTVVKAYMIRRPWQGCL